MVDGCALEVQAAARTAPSLGLVHSLGAALCEPRPGTEKALGEYLFSGHWLILPSPA